MLITKVKPGIYMSGWMVVWAAVSGTNPSSRSHRLSRSLTSGSFDRVGPKLWWTSRLPILPRHHGGACKFPFSPPIVNMTMQEYKMLTEPLQFYPGATYILSIFYTRRGTLMPATLPFL